jgi:putative FmdB family regulatory protein
MPAYDYDCAACGRRFEVSHGVHADPPTACPLCGSGPVRKAITAAAIHYKGSGWAKKERRATAAAGATKSTGEGSAGEASSAADDGSKSDAGTPGPAKKAAAAKEAGAASKTD